jgi:hypothetical protein
MMYNPGGQGLYLHICDRISDCDLQINRPSESIMSMLPFLNGDRTCKTPFAGVGQTYNLSGSVTTINFVSETATRSSLFFAGYDNNRYCLHGVNQYSHNRVMAASLCLRPFPTFFRQCCFPGHSQYCLCLVLSIE